MQTAVLPPRGVIFSKTGDARYWSHLDLMRIFDRASRRAALPVRATEGFSPHLKIRITKALKLGIESNNEEADFFLYKNIPAAEFIERLNRSLPAGIRIEGVRTGIGLC